MNKEPPDKSYMLAIKNTFKNLLVKNINQEYIRKIDNAIKNTNKIVFHTYNFLSLYFIHLYQNNIKFPIIDEDFILIIMIIVSQRKDKRGGGRMTKKTKILINRLK